MENNGNTLAKVSLGINVVLIIAVIILFVKLPSGEAEVVSNEDDTLIHSSGMPAVGGEIAYFNADSLNSQLLFMKELEGEIEKAQKGAEDRMRQKEREIQAWQEKWASKGQLLPSEQQTYAQEAQLKEQEIGLFQQQVQFELAQQQEGLMVSAIQRITAATENLSKEVGYSYVFSYQFGQNMYYAAPGNDITADLVEILNEDYKESSGGGLEEEIEAGEE